MGLVAGKQLREVSCGGEEAEMVVWGGRGEWTWEAKQQREPFRQEFQRCRQRPVEPVAVLHVSCVSDMSQVGKEQKGAIRCSISRAHP